MSVLFWDVEGEWGVIVNYDRLGDEWICSVWF